MNLTLLLISFLTFNIFVFGIVYRKYGIRTSISEGYYYLKNRTLFILWAWLTGIPIVILSDGSFFGWAAAGLLGFVGASGDARSDDMTSGWHNIGAKGTVIAGWGLLIFTLGLWPLAVISFIGTFAMWKLKIKNDTWWIEVYVYYTIILGFVLRLYIL